MKPKTLIIKNSKNTEEKLVAAVITAGGAPAIRITRIALNDPEFVIYKKR